MEGHTGTFGSDAPGADAVAPPWMTSGTDVEALFSPPWMTSGTDVKALFSPPWMTTGTDVEALFSPTAAG